MNGLIHTCRISSNERAGIWERMDERKALTPSISVDELLSRIEENLSNPRHVFESFVVKGVYYNFTQFMGRVSFQSYEIGKAKYYFGGIWTIPESERFEHLKDSVSSFVDFHVKA